MEQGLTVLLYESFYVCKDCWDQRRLSDTLNTQRAFLLCVCSDMTHEILRSMESLVTVGAGVLLLPHMRFYMCPHVSSSGKSLFTLRTGVWLLSCVDSTVFVQAIG